MDIPALVALAINALPSGTTVSVTFTRTVVGATNFAAGTRVADVKESFTANCVFLPAAPDDSTGDMRNTRERRLLYVIGSACPWPLKNDVAVTIADQSWSVDSVEALALDAVTVALYTVRASR